MADHTLCVSSKVPYKNRKETLRRPLRSGAFLSLHVHHRQKGLRRNEILLQLIGGNPPSVADLQAFIFSKMKRMVVSISLPDGKIGKYVLTKKESGDILSENDFFEKFDDILAFNNENYIDLVKEILNDTNYEILFIG